jgi:hypothetical protein
MSTNADGTVFRLPIKLEVNHITGRDPEKMTEVERRQDVGLQCTYYCESLFWAVKQLGLVKQEGGWILDETDLGEALERIGELGAALAQGAGEQFDMIGRLTRDE